MKVVVCEKCGNNIKCITDHGSTLKDCNHCVAEFYLACQDKTNPKERVSSVCSNCIDKQLKELEEEE